MNNSLSESTASSGGMITLKAPFVGSQRTWIFKASTSSEGLALPNLDFCSRSARTRAFGDRAGPPPAWGGAYDWRIDMVRVPPRRGSFERFGARPGIVGGG
jgi:hypothetical protein